MYTLNIFILMLFILIGVAFLTLLERKILGYMQMRKGPNKVGFMGIMQPFSDAIKLFTKELMIPKMSMLFIFYMCPLFSLLLSLMTWLVFPFMINFISFNFGMLYFICCTSMGVYMTMISGWSSCSNYSLLGSLRAVAQTISYEVSLTIMLLSLIMLISSYNIMDFFFYQNIWFMLMMMPLAMSWMSSSMAETNRTPFDFSEGESELVSGFNVEYSGVGFAYLFLSEYTSIIFMSTMFTIMFLGCNLNSFSFFMKITIVCFIFIWVRGTLPRFRYDKLMYMAWKTYLPMSINYLIFFIGFKMIII